MKKKNKKAQYRVTYCYKNCIEFPVFGAKDKKTAIAIAKEELSENLDLNDTNVEEKWYVEKVKN